MNISLKIFKRAPLLAQTILLTLFAALIAGAQTSGVDPTFNAVPDKNLTTPSDFILQPDNKIIVFGNFQAVNGAVKNQIARLNTDGSIDSTFTCATCDFPITSAVAQPDGKIIVAGGTGDGVVGQSRLFRLNADGSLDASFTSPFPAVAFPERNSADVRAVLPDGKILAVLLRSFSNSRSFILYRLNPNGTIDNTFTAITVTSSSGSFFSQPSKISVQTDGKILTAVNNSSGATGSSTSFRRYNADGSVDSTFEPPSFTNSGGNFAGTRINDFEIRADGSLIVAGSFTTINGVNRLNVAKLLPAGNVDTSFSNSLAAEILRVKVLPDGKVLTSSNTRFFRLNADGSSDNSFVSPTNILSIFNWMIDSAGRIFFYATFTENNVPVNKFARLNPDGSLEISFAANLGVAASVTAVAAQTDGKVIFAGDFLRVGGAARTSIARVNSDGSLDTTFNTGSGFSGGVSKILVQADGKILVGGTFSSFNGASRFGIARLNQNGSLDTDFTVFMTFVNAGFPQISQIALQPDGKIIVAGTFNTVDGRARTGVARLNADGRLDVEFNPSFGNPTISGIVVQPDGKITIGGTFSGVNGFSRTNMVRLNADGTLDNSFNAGTIAFVNQIQLLPDGRYLVVANGNRVFRLSDAGATDASYAAPTFNDAIFQILALPDAGVIVVGAFTQINSAARSRIARLTPGGALDRNFLPTGANAAVRTIAAQTDGRVLVGGDFSSIGGVTRLSVARLNVAAYRPITAYDFDGDSRADVAVFRPANGNWYVLPSQTGNFYGFPFGQAGDQIAPADYDGDGKTDIAVFRDTVPGAGDKAYFYILNSADNSFRQVQFGTQGDAPVPGDWDGDGKTDFAVYRNGGSNQPSYFYYRPSAQPTIEFVTIQLGTGGDKPVPADYDGDGRLDPAVFQSSSATWLILRSGSNTIIRTFFGLGTDIPTPADFDGDGAANLAVFRPSNGTWYTSQNPATNFGAIQFGANGDLPIAADYDGDGRADVAVFRPSNGAWYLNRSTSGFTGVQFGASGDKPAPNAYTR